MKTIQKMVAGLIACAVVGLAAQAIAAPVDQVAKVVRVEGGARYSMDNKTWQVLKAGVLLKPGCVIQTAEQSEVDLQLLGAGASPRSGPNGNNIGSGMNDIVFNGSVNNNAGGGGGGGSEEPASDMIRIQESSVLAIDKMTSDQTGGESVEEIQLDLRAGSIAGNVKKLSAASRYEVKIPNGVAGIRGTFYWISSSGAVNVVTGSVMVVTVDASGKITKKEVKAGESYNPITGQVTPINPIEEALLAAIVRQFHLESPPIAYNPPGAPGVTVYVTPLSQGSGG